MKIDTADMISISEASSLGLSRIANDAAEGRARVILRNNRAIAAVVSVTVMDRLQELDEREENLRLLGVALARLATDTGKRTTLRDAAARFGIDLDSLGEDDDLDDEE